MTTPSPASRDETRALLLDEQPDAALHRAAFVVPPAPGGPYAQTAYFAGNSLGLQPRSVRADLDAQLDKWATIAVEGHFTEPRQWRVFPDDLSEAMARVVGARPREVFVMNTLTVNLHLLLVSFYRPSGTRTKIVIEDYAFPSDSYAARSHAAMHGLDPDDAVLRLRPRPGEDTLRTEDVIATITEHGDEIATVMLAGVNYLTGEVLDMAAITAAGHAVGATVGWDLAHAAGNIELALHDWDADFAAWCTYKYLNAGPGAIASIFVHERHLDDPSVPRLEGWFGNAAPTQFLMRPTIERATSARAWAQSTPPILSMVPVASSLDIFDAAGMPALRARSLRLTDYLVDLLAPLEEAGVLQVVTPRDPAHRGTQLSLRVFVDPAELKERLHRNWGVLPDDRNPDILRFAPAPLYVTFHDCWRAADALARELTGKALADL